MKIIYANLDPEDVDIDDVEDFLATDDLFVEYFNAFLALPSFPAPLCFNKESGGFEVVNDARKEISKQIKAAIRSQKRTPRIYKPVKKHSFIDIPLIPIEEPEGPENVEINTSYTVTTLNKEQGIHWIKEERLPAFLESDLYLEFRLAKLISQSKITGEHGEYVLMRIDFIPRVKKPKKTEEDDGPKVDPKEQMIKDMYVSMGGATTTEAESWFTVAKITQDNTQTTYSSMSRPKSSDIVKRPSSARPVSAYSTRDSYRCESGMGASVLSSVYSSGVSRSGGGIYASKFSVMEDEQDVYSSKLFAVDGKPMTPRPSETVCYVTDDHSGKSYKPFNFTVYSSPKIERDGDNESGLGGDDDIESLGSGPKDEELNSRSASCDGSMESIVFKNMDELGAAIVSAVLRRSITQLTHKDEIEILADPELSKHLPNATYLTLEMLDRVSLVEETIQIPESDEDSELKALESKEKDRKNKKDDESDADSLLDSEDDYEEERDLFFRKHKHKTYKLTDRKGIEQFKKFLSGTVGEKNWQLWIDIDRIQFLKKKLGNGITQEYITNYLADMRELYQKPGALYELSNEQKMSLGLSEPASWTLEKLQLIQNKIAEPLVLYWAPRFLIKQMTRSNPEKNELYKNLTKLKSAKEEVYPNPPTTKLLPLRPKSCIPRLRGEMEPSSEESLSPTPIIPKTSPPVGLKRVYNVQSSRTNQKAKSLISPKLPLSKSATPRAKSSRSKSAVSHKESRSTSARPASSRPLSSRPTSSCVQSSRPVSAGSERSDISIVSKATPQPHQEPKEKTPIQRSRPQSARSEHSVASSKSSEFNGGKRMESLLQALHHERGAGGFFHKYVERSMNKMWINCLNFWGILQEYHLMFYSESMNPSSLQKKAKTIYSQYIVIGSPKSIGVTQDIRRAVFRCLEPPYEELFDAAEEYSLSHLYVAWIQMIEEDNRTYSKVELIEIKKHLETKSKYVLNLQKKGLIKERVITPEDPMEGYNADPVYDENLITNIPTEFQDYTLEKLVHNRIELEHFRQFLNENYASMDLLCWMDIEQFRRMPPNDERKRDAKAKELKVKYLNKKYFFGPNSPAGRDSQDKIMTEAGGWGKLLNDRPPNSVLLEAQKHVQTRLEKKWLPLFLVTEEFAERQKPNAGMDDVVDDVMVQKKKKSQAVLKLLESKWVSSSKEIITFRKALMNPVTSLQFRRYVSIKGDTLENDVLFWLEVQNFKNMNHAHADDTFVMNKIQTIINCFIDSQIPPSLHIDISNEMAERILDHKYERNPYLFRESQFAVFRVLFSHWNDFCEFRSNLADEKVLPTIERRRRHAKMKEKQKQKQEEEKALREQERRLALGLGPGDDLEAYHDPFATHGEGSEGMEEEDSHHDKEKLSWSYSTYMAALQREEVLNNTDEATFSSLMSDTASQKGSEKGEKESDSTKLSGANNSTTNKKEMKTEQTQTSPEKKKTLRMSPSSEPSSVDSKGGSKKKKEVSIGKRQVDFPTMKPLEEEVEEVISRRPVGKKVKVKINETHLTKN